MSLALRLGRAPRTITLYRSRVEITERTNTTSDSRGLCRDIRQISDMLQARSILHGENGWEEHVRVLGPASDFVRIRAVRTSTRELIEDHV